MRWIYSVVLWFIISSVSAQGIDVRIDNSIVDFGYIKEADGKVYNEFVFQNHSPFRISVYKVISSCGCAVATADDGWIQPKGTGKIKVHYDPTGRPGKFVKSIEIQFVSDSLKTSAYVNIKGYTIEKELLESYDDNLYEGTQLMIKPFSSEVISSSDYRFLNDPKFQHFINDITYEIDQNGFANISLTFYNEMPDTDCKLAKEIYPVAHKYIVSELQRRNYAPWSVGFTDNTCSQKKGHTIYEPGGQLIVSSRDYNNDTIRESGFYFSGKTIDAGKFQFNQSKDSADFQKKIIEHFPFVTIKDFSEEKNKSYSKFISASVRRLVLERKANIALYYQAKIHPDDEEKIRKKILASLHGFYEKILAGIDENGGIKEQVTFLLPVISLVKDTLQKKGKPKLISQEFRLFYPEIPEKINENPFTEWASSDSTGNKKLSDFLTLAGFKAPKQYLPVLEFDHTGQISPDTNSISFKTWAKILLEEMKSGKKVECWIESSVATSPLKPISETDFLARKNAKKMTEILQQYFSKKTGNDSLFSIHLASADSRGLAYSGKEFKMNSNENYNFIKMIPCVLPNKLSEKDVLIPYKINFNNNSFTLPVNTSIFQNFISRLIPALDKQGYLNLVVESSSSKIPSTVYKSNELLSYYRAEEAIQKVREEIRKRGYDPSRVIVTEVRTLIQGPEFKKESDKKVNNYEKYQYVKIIPQELIKD